VIEQVSTAPPASLSGCSTSEWKTVNTRHFVCS
jgi:hypothetical protein